MVALLAHIKSSAANASVRLLQMLVALFLTLVLSLFLYGTLYYAYIPPSYHELPLHFIRRNQALSSHGFRPNASEALATSRRVPADHQSFGVLVAELDTFVDATGVLLPLFAPGHSYMVAAEFQLPESEGNVNLGTFTLGMQTYDRQKQLLQASNRMLRLRYRSWLLRVMDTLLFAPLYLFSSREQKQTLTVEVFDAYVENAYRPTAHARLEVSDGRVELYAAVLVIRVTFVGLRYWMFHWPLFSAIVGVSSFECFFLVVLISSWLARSKRRAPSLPAATQIVSATNLPEVGAAESVSSTDVLPSVEAAPSCPSGSSEEPQDLAADGLLLMDGERLRGDSRQSEPESALRRRRRDAYESS